MRRSATVRWAMVASTVIGCSTMRPAKDRFPGAVDANPKAVNRVYPASATRVAWAMAEVMSKDPILDDVQVMVDPQSNESRPFSDAERDKLGISRHKIGSHDVNYDITAKSKDGHRVGAIIFLKGESDAEVSLLYGVGGDPELSRALFDQVEVALGGPLKDPGIRKASATRAPSRKAENR